MTPATRRIMRATVFALITAFASVAAAPAHAQDASLEYQVKATFLYRFASFVTWPAGAFDAADAPLNLCVVGPDPFGHVLDEAVRHQQIGGRGIVVRRLSAYDPSRTCHVLYTSDGRQAVEQTLRAARGQPVLTVTDADTSDTRGVVHFIVVDNRVRFHIDDARAAEQGLTISSRLLDLAASVRRRASP